MKIGDHVKYRGMVGIITKHEIRKFVRNGKPVVYKVNAKNMVIEGYTFRLSKNGVWLIEQVPSKYLEKLEL